MCTSLDLVRLISTKNPQRETYILKSFAACVQSCVVIYVVKFFACLFSIRTCLYVMCQPKLDLSWSFALKTNVTCDVLQTQYNFFFYDLSMSLVFIYWLTCDYYIKQTKFYKYISNIISNYFFYVRFTFLI